MPVLLDPSLDIAEAEAPVFADAKAWYAIPRAASGPFIDPRIRNAE